MIRWILWSLAFGNQKGNNFAHRILKKVSLVQNRQCGGRRFEDNALVFWEKDRQALPSHHNQPLYVIAYVHDTELKSALIDPDSSLNIMLFSTHEALRIPRGRSLSNQSKSGLRENASSTLSYINLDFDYWAHSRATGSMSCFATHEALGIPKAGRLSSQSKYQV